MASSIDKLKKELTKANDALYARYDALVNSAKTQESEALSAIDKSYERHANNAAAQTALARANAKRGFANQGLGGSGEEAQNVALYQIGLQNTLGELAADREGAIREVKAKTAETVAGLEAEREKEYADNQMQIALQTAQMKSAASSGKSSGGGGTKTEESEKVEVEATTDPHVYQPLMGIFKYIPSAQRYYVHRETNNPDAIKSTTTPSSFINKLINQYTTNSWDGTYVDEAKIKSAIKNFLQDDTVDRSYRAEVRMLAIALGYV